MTAVSRDLAGAELELGMAEFRRIASVVHKHAGIVLADSKRSLVRSRLTRRVHKLGLKSFDHYCHLIEGKDGGPEMEELILAITTNVTSFFREKHHFEYLQEQILPGLVARVRSGGRVRIWSSACSSGEEPYSIALTVLAACPEAAKYDFRILATDIDKNVLAQAELALYSAQVAGSVPKPLAQKYLVDSAATGQVRVADEARALITFKQLNLLKPWPLKGQFDVIFCRNVVIYFDRPTQETLWGRFADVMAPEGHIMIGHSERISGPMEKRMRQVGITTYCLQ